MEQYASNQLPVGKKDTAKASKRNLKDETRKCMEELNREEDISDLLEEKTKTIQLIENHRRKLAKLNQQLSTELQKISSKIPLNQDCKTSCLSFVKCHDEDRYYEPEQVIACHFRDSEEKLNQDPWRSSKLTKNKHNMMSVTEMENMPVEEQEENQSVQALLEANNLEKDPVIHSKPIKYLYDLWGIVKCKFGIVLGFGFCTYLISYTYYFNPNFIADCIMRLFSAHDIAELTQWLSPFLTWRNNGLLPF